VWDGSSYAKLEGELDFDDYMDGPKNGRSYVPTGNHTSSTSADERELEPKERASSDARSPSRLRRGGGVLPEQDEVGAFLASRPLDERPYWDIERARVGTTRNVRVELVSTGSPWRRREIVADGE
jgi:hypothetical protein